MESFDKQDLAALSKSTTLVTDGASLAWRDVSVSVPLSKKVSKQSSIFDEENPILRTKDILCNVSGYVEQGQLLFIMGPSGSGKSTILDSLADRVKLPVHGVQVLNGKMRTANALKAAAKYVQQSDDLLGVLTVAETLETAAELYISDASKRKGAVRDVMAILGLSAHAHTKIGNAFVRGLSGGQLRRVSIGCEMVAAPSLLFLDEPTSGLDSATAFKVMGELKRIAKATGTAIVLTVHQPSGKIFDMADTLLLISEGRTCYFGPPNNAADHFRLLGFVQPKRTSEIEWMLDLVNKDFGDIGQVDICISGWPGSKAEQLLMDDLKRLNVPKTVEDEKRIGKNSSNAEYAVSFWQQTMTLTKRGIRNTIRNPAILWLRSAMYLALSLMIGLVWLRLGNSADRIIDINNALMYVCAFMVFMSVSVLPAYLEERAVLVRERANGAYSIPAYIVSHTLYEIPYVFLLAFLASSVTYWMVGLTPSAQRFFVFVANLFTSLFVAESIMVLISALIPILIVGIAAGAMTFGLFMCVMGAFISIERIGWWMRWIHYIALHYYSYSTFLVNQFSGVVFTAAPDAFPPFPENVQGDDIVRAQGLEERIWINFAAQIAMIIVYRVLAAGWMHTFIRGKK